jgi:hypothetical protein
MLCTLTHFFCSVEPIDTTLIQDIFWIRCNLCLVKPEVSGFCYTNIEQDTG